VVKSVRSPLLYQHLGLSRPISPLPLIEAADGRTRQGELCSCLLVFAIIEKLTTAKNIGVGPRLIDFLG
jgi:hypothetical protein